ncbi:MAG TPA: polysaccharide deacetylase family protein [Cyclobacteriaceae bacterium]|jgi:peptidoglycan/xylan/chitin deacetylase (PgdA/CDA1 family)|nr:polysaccharide deacetylase family protein [Cyclobacteriaceae bacterium]
MILLSFDVEEFDVPDEFGFPIPFEEQIEISRIGTVRILDCLLAHHVKATFFVTVQFANHAPEIIARILAEGHEIGSHGYYHSQFEEEHLLTSKMELEKMTGKTIKGYRMARMMPVSDEIIRKSGYKYNTSLNPTWIPGRYNNFSRPRTYFMEQNVLQLPASVTPIFRFPLFWISFHVLPMWLYLLLCRWTLRHDRYLNLYFHPWEYVDLSSNKQFELPFYITKNSGEPLVSRLDKLIQHFKAKGATFARTDEFVATKL